MLFSLRGKKVWDECARESGNNRSCSKGQNFVISVCERKQHFYITNMPLMFYLNTDITLQYLGSGIPYFVYLKIERIQNIEYQRGKSRCLSNDRLIGSFFFFFVMMIRLFVKVVISCCMKHKFVNTVLFYCEKKTNMKLVQSNLISVLLLGAIVAGITHSRWQGC